LRNQNRTSSATDAHARSRLKWPHEIVVEFLRHPYMMHSMTNSRKIGIVALVALGIVGLFFIAWYVGPDREEALGDASARSVVEAFGQTLKNVPLTGTDAIAREAIEQQYAPFVTPELLAAWLANPDTAPGRLTSSPSPDRLTIATVETQGRGRVITGEVIMVTSADTVAEPVDTVPFTAQVVPTDSGWKIAAYQEEKVQTLKNLPKTDEDIPGAR
jgi:hypothetical protein